MLDLWSNFDSYCFSSYSMWWLWATCFVCVALTLPSLSLSASKFSMTSNKMSLLSWNLVKETSGSRVSGFSTVIVSLFVVLFTLNLIGLVPYTFSITSQLSVSLPLSVLMWSSLIVSSLRISFSQVYSSLIPSFAPMGLTPFLLIVEMVTICSRPLTLGFRLLINIISGHLIMSMGVDAGLNGLCSLGVMLTSKNAFLMSALSFMLGSSAWMVLLAAELGVAFLQGYIFCILLSLYSNEHAN